MNKIFRLRNIYLVFIIYFINSCITGEQFLNMDVAEFMEKYFGISQYLIMLILIANYLLSFIKNERRRTVFTFINYYLYVGFISFATLWLGYKLGVLGKFTGIDLEYPFVKLAVFEYKLGLIPSYISSLILLSENEKIFYGGIGIAIFNAIVITIIGVNWLLVHNFRNIKNGYIRRKNLEEEEAVLREKIAIKEAVEKTEIEQIKRMNIEAEKRIREEVIENNPVKDEYDIDEIRSNIQNEMERRKK